MTCATFTWFANILQCVQKHIYTEMIITCRLSPLVLIKILLNHNRANNLFNLKSNINNRHRPENIHIIKYIYLRLPQMRSDNLLRMHFQRRRHIFHYHRLWCSARVGKIRRRLRWCWCSHRFSINVPIKR